MQTVEEFMEEYFDVRNSIMQSEFDAQQPFRERYFSPGCDDPMCKSYVVYALRETVIEVISTEAGPTVYTINGGPEGKQAPKRRYDLMNQNGRWIIDAMAYECFVCKGKGLAKFEAVEQPCIGCNGRGYHGGKDVPRDAHIRTHRQSKIDRGCALVEASKLLFEESTRLSSAAVARALQDKGMLSGLGLLRFLNLSSESAKLRKSATLLRKAGECLNQMALENLGHSP